MIKTTTKPVKFSFGKRSSSTLKEKEKNKITKTKTKKTSKTTTTKTREIHCSLIISTFL